MSAPATDVGAQRAQTQVARMLQLVPYLQARDGVPVTEVARDFGVSKGQIIKDLNVLWFCGLPNGVSGDMIDVDMDALEEDGVVRLSNAEYLARPLRLSGAEALGLIVALRTLLESAGPRERAPIERALAKIETAAGERSSQAAAIHVQVEAADPQIRETVETALRDGRRLHLTYYVARRDETTERDVDPFRLVAFEGRPYLEAFCHRAGETRLFRMDGITAATVLDIAADRPAEDALLDLSRGPFQPDPDAPVAVLHVEPSARWIVDYYPVEDTSELPGGGLRVVLRYADEDWLRRLVLRLSGAATVVRPAELAAAVRRTAADALALYGGASSDDEHPGVSASGA